ncbi:MAG: hypothetical protein JHC19_06815 [Desulfurococcaceae archaeon]|jgi:hypothetical protein|nr:hypothetical protein [Desulfurococcaceae archaeon]
MIKTDLEKKYLVKKGGEKFLVEIRRTNDGRMVVVVEKRLKHIFTKNDEEMEWEQDTKNAEEIEYEKLPEEVRRTLSKMLTR